MITHFGGDDFPNCRYFFIAGIAIRVESDLPMNDSTFAAKFKKFQISRPDLELVRIIHHFSLPRILPGQLGLEIYRKPPWTIYHKGFSWIYLASKPGRKKCSVYCFAVFNEPHTLGQIYHEESCVFNQGDLHSLTLFPTDQIWLARVLAERQGFFLHTAGMKIKGQGLLFAGHAEAGKSTVVTILRDQGEILCDDRIIVRRRTKGFRIYGTWSHGEVPQVSAADAPLRAILFLEKAKTNRLVPIANPQDKLKRILPLLIKPLVTADWWEKTLAVIEKLVREVPAYRLQFDKSGKIKDVIKILSIDHMSRNESRGKKGLP